MKGEAQKASHVDCSWGRMHSLKGKRISNLESRSEKWNWWNQEKYTKIRKMKENNERIYRILR